MHPPLFCPQISLWPHSLFQLLASTWPRTSSHSIFWWCKIFLLLLHLRSQSSHGSVSLPDQRQKLMIGGLIWDSSIWPPLALDHWLKAASWLHFEVRTSGWNSAQLCLERPQSLLQWESNAIVASQEIFSDHPSKVSSLILFQIYKVCWQTFTRVASISFQFQLFHFQTKESRPDIMLSLITLCIFRIENRSNCGKFHYQFT